MANPEETAESISQDDIDQLLQGKSNGGETSSDDDIKALIADTLADVSQDDISRMLDEVNEVKVEEKKADTSSSEDIDSLLKGLSEESVAGLEIEEDFISGGNEMLSGQDDIDRLLQDAADRAAPIQNHSSKPADNQTSTKDTSPVQSDDAAESFSQDDIDALMAGGAAPAPQPEPPPAETPDETAESFSQDDIDALLSGGAAPAPEPAGDTSESISQDDIDALLSGGAPSKPNPEPVSESTSETVSQDDIDALLSGGVKAQKEPAPADNTSDSISQDDIDALLSGGISPEPAPETLPGAASESISQDDIDALLSGGGQSASETQSVPEENSSGLITQNDLDALLSGDSTPEPAATIVEPSSAAPKGFISATPEDLKELKAGNIDPESNLIKQEQVDHLFDNFDPNATAADDTPQEPGDETQLISQDDIDSLLNNDLSADMTMALEPEDGGTGLITQDDIDGLLKGDEAGQSDDSLAGSLVSQNDIDQLLSSDNDEESSEGLISQDDIDSLLQSSDGESEKSDEIEDSLISQDDIDKLLKGDFGDQADGLEEEEEKKSDLVSQSEIDDLLRGALGEDTDNEPEQEQDVEVDEVILKEAEDDETTSSEEDDDRPWYRTGKGLAVGSAVAAVLLIGCSFLAWHVYSKKALKIEVAKTVETVLPDAPLETAAEQPILSIVLNDFVVLAPESKSDVAYLKANVSIKFSKEISAKEIKAHAPYFRSVIYEILNQELVAQKKDEQLDKKALEGSVKKALNKALPEKGVDQIFVSALGVI